MTQTKIQSRSQSKSLSTSQHLLRHPNVMTEAERLALPDPCRPIDERVRPARHAIELYMQRLDIHTSDSQKQDEHDARVADSRAIFQAQFTDPQSLNPATKTIKKSLPIHESDMVDRLISEQAIDIRQFIKQQQQRASNTQTKNQSLHLPLSLLPRIVNDSSISLMKEVMSHYPHLAIMNTLPPSIKNQPIFNTYQNPNLATQQATAKDQASPNQNAAKSKNPQNSNQSKQTTTDTAHPEYNQALLNIETKLYLMGQMYHIMVCVFLLCQCKSRKSLNPQITLQDLANSMNEYIEAHRTELHFLTQHEDLFIEPKHIEIAAIAMDWQVGKQADIKKRTTTISSQNPLMSG